MKKVIKTTQKNLWRISYASYEVTTIKASTARQAAMKFCQYNGLILSKSKARITGMNHYFIATCHTIITRDLIVSPYNLEILV